MRHGVKGKKFSMKRGRRKSFLRNLANDVLRAGRVETTEVRAKAIRPVVERLITLAKDATLARRRLLESRMHDKRLVQKLCDDIAPRYKERPGGYLRIVKLGGWRKRDGARLARIEFVQ